jgi:hypothetical protein
LHAGQEEPTVRDTRLTREGLGAFCHRDWVLSLAEIARRSGMPKSTAHRVLAMLLEHWQIPLDQWTTICAGASQAGPGRTGTRLVILDRSEKHRP